MPVGVPPAGFEAGDAAAGHSGLHLAPGIPAAAISRSVDLEAGIAVIFWRCSGRRNRTSISSKSMTPSHSSQRQVGALLIGALFTRSRASSRRAFLAARAEVRRVEALDDAVRGEVVDEVDLRDDRR